MKKTHCIGLLAGALGLVFMMNAHTFAHEKVIVVPLNSSKVSNTSRPCDSSTAGVIRWTGGDFEGCNGKAWTSLTPVPTVYSSGHEWMEKNLGASRVATSSTDAEAYGDLYQWGRFSDGHEKRTSSMIGDQSINDDPGHGSFINVFGDWLDPRNDNLWQDSGINNPCPAGYRIPTTAEWAAERQSWSSNDAAGAFSSPLKLVMAGHRDQNDGTLGDAGTRGIYWSSISIH